MFPENQCLYRKFSIPFLRIFIMALVIWKPLNAQENKRDSIYALITKCKIDTEKVNLYNSLSKEALRLGELDSSLVYATSALKLAKSKGFSKGESESLNQIGLSYNYMSDNDKALEYFFIAAKLMESQGNKKSLAGVYNNIGNAYSDLGNFQDALLYYFKAADINIQVKNDKWLTINYNNIGLIYSEQGNYPEALSIFYKAQKICEKSGDKMNLARNYDNIGNLYIYLKNYKEALRNHELALKLYVEIEHKKGIAASYNNIGLDYSDLNLRDKALQNYYKALDLNKEIGNQRWMGNNYGNIALLYHNEHNYKEALINYNLAQDILEQTDNKLVMAGNLANIGKLYIDTKQYDLARKALNKALILSKEIGSLEDLTDDYHWLSVLDSATGNYGKAYDNYKNYVFYRDSVYNLDNTKKMVQQQMQYIFDKKQTTDSISNAENLRHESLKHEQEINQQKTYTLGLIIGFILMLVAAGASYNAFKQKQKTNEIILQQKHIVEEKHKEITDSINYAERIQRSFLATKELLDKNLNEYFIIFKPKDVVSGDFYWASSLNNGNFTFVTADSTGHGVPGAIMSLLNITSLEKAIERENSPDKILNLTRTTIIERLKKDGSKDGGKDGMDCSIITFNKEKTKLEIASAHNPVWIVRNDEIIEIKPDKMPVGKHDNDNVSFTLQQIDLQKGDVVYTLTDGFPDQFGGEKGKKFMSKKLRELIAKNAHLTMEEQKRILESTFAQWIGNLEQVDDVTVIGVRI